MLRAESGDELLVGILLTVLVENAHVGLATVQSLGGLTETAGETVVHESKLQNALESILDGHLTLGGFGRHFDLLDDLGNVVVFYVRLLSLSVSCPCTQCYRFLRPVIFFLRKIPSDKSRSMCKASSSRSRGGLLSDFAKSYIFGAPCAALLQSGLSEEFRSMAAGIKTYHLDYIILVGRSSKIYLMLWGEREKRKRRKKVN